MKKKIVIGITGSIAAFKTVQLISDLNKMNYDLEVILTDAASKFVTPVSISSLTKKKVYIDIFDDEPDTITHIDIVKDADAFIIVPASANTIAKVAHGFADNMLTAAFLAATCPKLIAPAMNVHMYENIVTQQNIQKCKDMGMLFIEPAVGLLACGDIGNGKLADNSDIIEMIQYATCKKTLTNKKVVVSAGPTQESIDPVRYITNHSSGKMGYAIARAARNMGADVTLVSGPTNIKKPYGINVIDIKSADDMYNAMIKESKDASIIIMSAAVADYTPATVADEKMKKSDDELSIELKRTKDILFELGQNKKADQLICGFAMETQDLIENATKKLIKKNCDMIVANHLKTEGAGFKGDTNVVSMITIHGIKEYGLLSKEELAYEIINQLVKEG